MKSHSKALSRKMALFQELGNRIPGEPLIKSELAMEAFMRIERFPIGRLHDIEHIRLDWINERFFEYMPDTAQPFGFYRSTGEHVVPTRMFTDGGSIPREFWWKQGLSPWEYAPAYLIHDWEFDVHHCHRGSKTFEQVRDTMMEALRTLMAMPIVTRRVLVFQLIYAGINSGYARSAWDADPGCTLPP